ncbi:hypothetical protein SAMN06265222_101107 [Neorhodopirellula lusitana]|uniref:Uncharacterized protein n=1 Tax=Neorhodopirellula lusitana TaxID=445327 RepID=A0ABY1PS89_9BACT|nr:hypothetical protein SAMN06265222_101107 [Neorhodopirellula lusitana]
MARNFAPLESRCVWSGAKKRLLVKTAVLLNDQKILFGAKMTRLSQKDGFHDTLRLDFRLFLLATDSNEIRHHYS